MRLAGAIAVICCGLIVIAGCSSSSSGPSLIEWFDAATWQNLSDFPPGAGLGAALVRVDDGTLYMTAGGNGVVSEYEFWRYDIDLDTWNQLADTIRNPHWATSLAWAGGDTIYMVQGNGTSGFVGYSIAADQWFALENYPGNVRRAGHSLVWPGQGGYLYCCEGNGTGTFERYDIASDVWQSLADIPTRMWHGSSIAWGGGSTIYAAADSLDFYAYDIGADMWTQKADYPEELYLGAWMTYDGDQSLFLCRGDTAATVWRYDIPDDGWESIEDAPGEISRGGTMACGDEALYVLQGGMSTEFWVLKE
jgi:hypothetical protein